MILYFMPTFVTYSELVSALLFLILKWQWAHHILWEQLCDWILVIKFGRFAKW